MNNINIVGFTGSLRKGSYNLSALKAAKEMMPEGVNFEILDLSSIPFFNEDYEEPMPESVKIFKEKLNTSDGILISTPEYNLSIPPVLKNAIDWASRGEEIPIDGKPTAIMSASISILGGIRAQMHLKQVCNKLNMRTINKPEVFITKANEKFDENGNLIDEHTRQSIRKLINALLVEIKNTSNRL